MYPKIELHVHLEGTVRAATLLEIARRNDYALPADTVEGLASLYEYRDFEHFIEVWILTTNALQTAVDFRQVVVDYAAEAAAHGAVYIEGIFSPAERVARGVDWDEIFAGYCDGARRGRGAARGDRSPDARHLPGSDRRGCAECRPLLVRLPRARCRRGRAGRARGAVSAGAVRARLRAGEVRGTRLGAARRRGCRPGVDSRRARRAQADRIRHGIRAVEDPELLAELAERRIVLDVSPVSNVRTGAVGSLAEHPLPKLVEAGALCSISTDDPAMFDTDLTRDYEAARSLGVGARAAFEAGLAGALCDDATRERLRELGNSFDWAKVPEAELV